MNAALPGGISIEPQGDLRVIEASHLTKDYGRFRAVDDVSFRIEPGEIVGLLGPNGSGKTTIMRMLTGFFAPTAGTCSLGGIDVTVGRWDTTAHAFDSELRRDPDGSLRVDESDLAGATRRLHFFRRVF